MQIIIVMLIRLVTNLLFTELTMTESPTTQAGLPIYGQIKSLELTNVLVVVVRYFGGTKLGVSGLINAYKSASKLALESSHISKKTITMSYRVDFEYKHMSKVMQLLKKNKIDIMDQQLEQKCSLFIAVPKSKAAAIYNRLNAYFGINITEL
jgi:putative IMPACT (imprinted ancient) family translation regulator